MIKIYNKLVRDQVPGLIEASGKKAITRVADDKEYQTLLRQKLQEEVNEFLESGGTEELADIIEVIRALGHTNEIPLIELIEMAKKKRGERGGFDSKVVLVQVED